MKKVMVVLSDESYGILKRYQEERHIANLDTALDLLISERPSYVGHVTTGYSEAEKIVFTDKVLLNIEEGETSKDD